MNRSFLTTLAATVVTCLGLSGLQAQDPFFSPTREGYDDYRRPVSQPSGAYQRQPYDQLRYQSRPQERPLYRPVNLDNRIGDDANPEDIGGCTNGRCSQDYGDRMNGQDRAAHRSRRGKRQDVNGSRGYQTRLTNATSWDPLNPAIDAVPGQGRQHFHGDRHDHSDGLGRTEGRGSHRGRCGNGQCDMSRGQRGQRDPYRQNPNLGTPNPDYGDIDLTRRNDFRSYTPAHAPNYAP